AGETMGYDSAARVAMGVNPAAMHAERVDGYDPLAVADAIRRKRPVLLSGEGPVLLDTVTYRIIGHAPTDPGTYRTKEEVGLWHAQDCIASFAQQLQDAAILTAAQYDQMGEQVVAKLAETFRLAADLEQAPRADAAFIESVMLSNQRTGPLSSETPELILPVEDSPRSRANASKPRSARNPDGSPISKARAFQYRDALYEAMAHGFATEPTMAVWGEEVRDWGGPFGVTRGLTEVLPYRRMFNSPISEASIVGGAVGYAISGGRAVVELMYNDFLGRCGDEVFNQMAKWQSMSAGLLRMPLTLRITVGDKFGAQHSQDWSAMVAHVPGLKVYCPATPADAKGMLNLALAGSDPVVFI
ncbi:MAG: dehydrogenase, partial [Propionibacteriaceae bacterium]|nr:dehydrogenase [Propionibacteriaceae bacterium]